jgi:Glycosyl hydrolases family 16
MKNIFLNRVFNIATYICTLIFCANAFAVLPSYQSNNYEFQDRATLENNFSFSSHGFLGNQSPFLPQNVEFIEPHGPVALNVSQINGAYQGSEIQRKDEKLLYGKFMARLKPACVSGTIQAFFLYRSNPWQEIDIEFLGKNPTQIQTSIVFNAGRDGDNVNQRAYTPKTFELGFNACEAFHDYSIEWGHNSVRFLVDGRLIDERAMTEQGIPNLPMQIYANIWLNSDPNWSGPIDPQKMPAKFLVEKISYETN